MHNGKPVSKLVLLCTLPVKKSPFIPKLIRVILTVSFAYCCFKLYVKRLILLISYNHIHVVFKCTNLHREKTGLNVWVNKAGDFTKG